MEAWERCEDADYLMENVAIATIGDDNGSGGTKPYFVNRDWIC